MTMNGYLQLGWNKSCVDVKVGEQCTIPWPKCNWSGTCVKYCSVAVWYVAHLVGLLYMPESHRVGLLYVYIYIYIL